MLGYLCLTAIAPSLDTQSFEARWTSYWKQGSFRRFIPAILATLLVLGSATPAHAVLGEGDTVFDPSSWAQSAEQFVEKEWEFMWDDSVTAANKLKDAALAYSAYKQMRDLYQRLATGNISLSLLSALPIIDIATNNGQDQTVIRPIIATKQRLAKFHPTMEFQSFDLSQLDFAVDHSTSIASDPLVNMSQQQIEQQAVDDGWQSWQLEQNSAGIAAANQGGIMGNTYNGVSSSVQQAYSQHGTALNNILQTCAQVYGIDSPQYAQAKQDYADWLTGLQNGEDSQASEDIVAQLQALDCQAEADVEGYAAVRANLDMLHKRQVSVQDNIRIISSLYDSDPKSPGFSLMNFLGIAGNVANIASTVGAMGGGSSTPGATSKEPLGQAQKQVALQQNISDNASEQLKLAMRQELADRQKSMLEIAQKKAEILTQLNSDQQTVANADQARLLAISQQTAISTMQVQAALSHLPKGCTPVVRPGMTASVQGAVTSDQGPSALATDVQSLSQNASQQVATNLQTATTGMAQALSWGFLRPIFVAFDSGWNSATGKTLNLTAWASAINGVNS